MGKAQPLVGVFHEAADRDPARLAEFQIRFDRAFVSAAILRTVSRLQPLCNLAVDHDLDTGERLSAESRTAHEVGLLFLRFLTEHTIGQFFERSMHECVARVPTPFSHVDPAAELKLDFQRLLAHCDLARQRKVFLAPFDNQLLLARRQLHDKGMSRERGVHLVAPFGPLFTIFHRRAFV